MSYDRNISIKRAFDHLAQSNPLRALNEWDRASLWAQLVVYAVPMRTSDADEAFLEPHRKLYEITVDARNLAEALESNLFAGLNSEILGPLTADYEDLPVQLRKLSIAVGEAVGSMGKPGHIFKAMTNVYLAMASEFVRMKTGQHYDEHLAELFQAVAANRRSLSADLSGDAIRKKREYLFKNYPALRSYAIEQATQMCKSADRKAKAS